MLQVCNALLSEYPIFTGNPSLQGVSARIVAFSFLDPFFALCCWPGESMC